MKENRRAPEPLWDMVSGLGDRIAFLEETVAHLKSVDLALHEIQLIVFNFAERMHEGMVLIQDNKIMWGNLAGCRMFGYEPEDLINTEPTSLVHPGSRQKLAERFGLIQAGNAQVSSEVWPFIRKDQTVIHIRSFGYRVIYRGRPAIMSFYYDVTEDRKLQEELSLRAEMLDLVSDSIFLHDMQGNIKYVNKAACESLGYTQDEIIKMNVIDINPEELKRRAQNRLKTISSEKGSRFKTVQVRKNGSRMQVDVKSKVIKIGNKEYVLGMVREIIPEGLQDI